jgi:hypothetical protein
MSKHGYNPMGYPEPRALGFQEGSPVLDLRFDLRGVVIKVAKSYVTIASGHILISCHPQDRFGLIHGPMTKDYRTP